MKHTGYPPGLCRGPTPPCRGVVPRASSKQSRENLGFPLKNMKNMIIWKMDASSQLVTKIWVFMPWVQNMDLGTHSRRSCKNKHKNMVSVPTFGSKRDFSSKHMNTIFFFRNQLQIDAWHAKQIRSCNAARWSITTVKVDHGSYLKAQIQRLNLRRSSLEGLFSLKNFSSFSLELLSLKAKIWDKMICL